MVQYWQVIQQRLKCALLKAGSLEGVNRLSPYTQLQNQGKEKKKVPEILDLPVAQDAYSVSKNQSTE